MFSIHISHPARRVDDIVDGNKTFAQILEDHGFPTDDTYLLNGDPVGRDEYNIPLNELGMNEDGQNYINHNPKANCA